MMQKRWRGCWLRRYSLIVLMIAGLTGCSTGSHLVREYVSESPSPSREMEILVLPFKNLTVHPGAGVSMARLLATELRKQGFRVRESSVKEDGSKREDEAALAEARAAGVDGVLLGAVTEFGYRFGYRKQPVVGVDLRLVRTDGTVLWAVSASETGSAIFGKDSVTKAAQRMIMRMVKSLSDKMEGEQ